MSRDPTPQFPIASILEHLGFVDVPRVHGDRYRPVRCAFHQERSPSAGVSEYGFRCHGCERRGDAIKLIRQEEGLSHADAVRRCAEITGTEGAEIPAKSGGESRWGAVLLPD